MSFHISIQAQVEYQLKYGPSNAREFNTEYKVRLQGRTSSLFPPANKPMHYYLHKQFVHDFVQRTYKDVMGDTSWSDFATKYSAHKNWYFVGPEYPYLATTLA